MKNTIETINRTVKSLICCDFEVLKYENNALYIGGGLSLSYKHTILIEFKTVFWLSIHHEWRCDTLHDFITIVQGDEAIRLNLKFHIETGYYLFKLKNEDNIYFYIAAKEVDIKNENV